MTDLQFSAANPLKSSWVSASAGSGKTKVLIDRLLRLLLLGEDFRSIVGFTYTNAAAAEMKSRLHDKLKEWAEATPEAREKSLENLLHRPPFPEESEKATTLYEAYLCQQHNLRIQTLHSFCKDFLEQFSLLTEMYITPTILDGGAAQKILQQIQEESFLDETAPAFVTHLQTLLQSLSLDQIDEVLQALLARRQDFAPFIQSFDQDSFDRFLHQKLDDTQMVFPFDAKKTCHLAEQLSESLATSSADRNILKAASQGQFLTAFFTQSQTPRKKLLSSPLQKSEPRLCEAFVQQAESFVAQTMKEKTDKLIQQTEALVQMADVLFQRYQEKKNRQNAYDFEDLIFKMQKLLDLLSTDEEALSACQKIFPLKHLFLDEAQDTSLPQWQIVMQLVHVFFKEAQNTVFVVGDIKQSIYSFQGARPWLFRTLPDVFQQMIERRGGTFQQIYLQTSYRTAPAILRAVDSIFQDNPQGIAFDEAYRLHRSARSSEGFVKCCSVSLPKNTPEVTAPSAKLPASGTSASSDDGELDSPLEALATTVVQELKTLLDRKLFLPSVGRNLLPEDVLILARKRSDLWTMIRQKLEDLGIPTASAGRFHLQRTLVGADLQAFVSFLVDPYDDYNLACLLKSPFLLDATFSEERLLLVCHDREGSLYDRILSDASFSDVKALLESYQNEARRSTTKDDFFQYFYRIVKFVEPFWIRTERETPVILEGFLDILWDFLTENSPSLMGLHDFLQTYTGAIASPTQSSGVRFMTVHGSKGLQAPLVFVVDPAEPLSLQKEKWFTFESHSHQEITGFLSMPPTTLTTKPAQKIRETATCGLLEESRRLLYVALTRAQDGLVVVGYRKPDSWTDLVDQALSAKEVEGTMEFDPSPLTREPLLSVAPPKKPKKQASPEPLPSTRTLPTVLPTPSSPQSLQPKFSLPDLSSGSEPAASSVLQVFPAKLRHLAPRSADDDSALIGVGVHRFIQALTESPFDETSALTWFDAHTEPVVAETLRQDPLFLSHLLKIPRCPEFTYLKLGKSEVSLFQDDHVCRIDFLFVDDNRVVVTEVKTTAEPPEKGAEMYGPQLARYCRILRRIFPQYDLSAYFLWARHGAFSLLQESIHDNGSQ